MDKSHLLKKLVAQQVLFMFLFLGFLYVTFPVYLLAITIIDSLKAFLIFSPILLICLLIELVFADGFVAACKDWW